MTTPTVLTRFLSTCASVAGLLGVPLVGAAHAEPVYDCGWSRRIGADTVNVAYPDTFANYWMAAVTALPPEGVTLRGTFPHGRYLSFTSYRGSATLDGLTDEAIEPDPGSVNPFRAGADRTAARRAYTVHIRPGPRPERPAPNTLYADPAAAVVLYRVYRPDAGLDPLGGAGLPQFTLNAADGPRTLRDCVIPDGAVDPNAVRLPGGIDLPALAGGDDPAVWRRTSGDGVFANPDNTYLASRLALTPGRIAVVSARLPRFPATFDGEASMGRGEVRYWSLCANQTLSTRVSACVVDDEVPVDAHGDVTVVVSDPADRPAGARIECGVAWLPTTGASTLLLMRNMSPSADFAQAIQYAPQEDPASTMGEYYPRTIVAESAEFVAPGCPTAAPADR